jgi:hypothetical protein
MNMSIIYFLVIFFIVLFLIDLLFIKPKIQLSKTEELLGKFKYKNHTFYNSLPKFPNDRGIITTVTDSTVLNCGLMIMTLNTLQSTLPVIIYYLQDEITEKNILFLNSLKNAKCVNLAKIVGLPINILRAKEIFATIYCPFKQVLIVDPMVVFLNNPIYLFGDTTFQQTGALFWKDPKIKVPFESKIFKWMETILPFKSKNNRILNKECGTFASKSLTLLDKEKHLPLLEKVWLFCQEPELLLDSLGSTKELFWIAAEIAKEPYSFIEYEPGIIGSNNYTGNLCGAPLFFDQYNVPLFFLGEIKDFNEYSYYYGNSTWKSILGVSEMCLIGAEKQPLGLEMEKLLNKYIKIKYDLKNILL